MTEISTTAPRKVSVDLQAYKRTVIMTIILLALGFYLIFPVFLILIQSFNTAPEILIETPQWGLGNWMVAFTEPRQFRVVGNTILIWALVVGVSFPIASRIVWANLMGNGIAIKVMLLTPVFRNMDASMEEAARVSGASDLRTMLRVTLPLMASPIVLVFLPSSSFVFSNLSRPNNCWVCPSVFTCTPP